MLCKIQHEFWQDMKHCSYNSAHSSQDHFIGLEEDNALQ